MESSRTRNSILDWLLAATIAATVISSLAGIHIEIGSLRVRSHGAVRLLAATLVLSIIRWRAGIEAWPAWVTRLILLTAISGSVATWFRFLLPTVGGADSWGYVSASQMIGQGRLIDPAPIAEWLSAANRLAIASPLGWAPAVDGSGIVPTYPLGLPIIMALFSAIGGSNAVFFVAPIAGLVTLALVYRLTREWYEPEVALFAAAIVAWNPVFIAYAKQPMSDMLATMWVVLALLLSQRATTITAVGAGLATGAAVLTRPALLLIAVIVPLAAYRGGSPLRRAGCSVLAFATIAIAQLWLQDHLFGSPFATGYGNAGGLFSWSYLPANLEIYVEEGWRVLGPLWIPGLLIGLIAARPEPRWKPAAIFGAVALPYLFYLPFDHWETLRFLLPGLVPLTIVVAQGLGLIARLHKRSAAAAVLTLVFMAIIAGRSENVLRSSSAWAVAELERRYPLAGEWVNVNTPPNAVILANQHSGSIRYYGQRQTLRWDFIDPPHLATAIRELQSHGAVVYVALEGAEERMFDERFVGVLEELQIDHVGRVRNVSFRRIRFPESPYFPNR